MPQKQDFSEVAALREFWVEEERAMREYLLGRTDSDLAGSIHYTTTRGVPFEEDLADILLHVVIHLYAASLRTGTDAD